jgi:AbrB family looped-hinge helix DNA binding protein
MGISRLVAHDQERTERMEIGALQMMAEEALNFLRPYLPVMAGKAAEKIGDKIPDAVWKVLGVRIQEKGQVTIPRKIREKLHLKRVDLAIFVETKDGVMVKPASVVAEGKLRREVVPAVRAIREQFADYSAEEIESLVDAAIRKVREKGE